MSAEHDKDATRQAELAKDVHHVHVAIDTTICLEIRKNSISLVPTLIDAPMRFMTSHDNNMGGELDMIDIFKPHIWLSLLNRNGTTAMHKTSCNLISANQKNRLFSMSTDHGPPNPQSMASLT